MLGFALDGAPSQGIVAATVIELVVAAIGMLIRDFARRMSFSWLGNVWVWYTGGNAFLEAGTRNLLVTLWPVRDDAARE